MKGFPPLAQPGLYPPMACNRVPDDKARLERVRPDRSELEPPHVGCDRGLQELGQFGHLGLGGAGSNLSIRPEQVANIVRLCESRTAVSVISPMPSREEDSPDGDQEQHLANLEADTGYSHAQALMASLASTPLVSVHPF